MATPKQGPEAVAKTVTIDANYNASPAYLSLSDGDTLVFHSNANQDCSIDFVPSGAFAPGNSITVPAGGDSDPIAIPQNLSETVDYFVNKPGGGTTGPYAATVDNGPLPIAVNSEAAPTPEIAAIPANGSLYFNYVQDDPNVPTIAVTFNYGPGNDPVFYDSNGNPVYSLTLNPNVNGELLTARGTARNVDYTTTPNPRATGGGTVKVGT